MSPEALLFDVDGTLAVTGRDGHRPAFNAAFREFGLDWDWDVPLYGKLLAVTGGKERMKHYVDIYRPDYLKPADFDDLVAELHRAKTRHYTAMLAEGNVPSAPASGACCWKPWIPACAWRSPPRPPRKTSPPCWNTAWARAAPSGSRSSPPAIS